MKTGFVFVILFVFSTNWAVAFPPLRQAEANVMLENDSYISGHGFWQGDDEGETFSWRFTPSLLFEDRNDPESDIVTFTLLTSTTLRTRFEGTETDDNRRRQFPEERNLYVLQAKFGRELYWRVQAGVQDLNYDPRGRSWFATYQQYKLHEISLSTDIENIDQHKPNVISFVGGAGVGGEFPLFQTIFENCLLFRYDFGFLLDSAAVKDTYVTNSCTLLLGTAPITQGDRPFLSLSLTHEMKVNRDQIDMTAVFGIHATIPVYKRWYIVATPVFKIPVFREEEVFYDQNPELILGIGISILWNR